MNRCRGLVALLVVALAGLGLEGNVHAESTVADDVLAKIASAEASVANAKVAIKNGKTLVDMIPEDSPLLPEVAQMLKQVSINWKLAVASLESAKESSAKIPMATSPELAADYALLATVNATVAETGANVVGLGLSYVEAVAKNKTESLDIIRNAMQDALAASSQVKFNCDKVKNLISQKYSN